MRVEVCVGTRTYYGDLAGSSSGWILLLNSTRIATGYVEAANGQRKVDRMYVKIQQIDWFIPSV